MELTRGLVPQHFHDAEVFDGSISTEQQWDA
jgi:hypothetical protein